MSQSERVVPDLDAALDQLRGEGFRLDSIYPADDPHSAVLSRGGQRLRITTSPNSEPPSGMPAFAPGFVLTRAGADGAVGRAGMIYRDLIPGRLGGRYIASHIVIPEGGPVADWVHYHRVAFQLIAVRSGWARLVYEDQGEPFVARAGDVVLQPPQIRHRVLESSPGLEVIEVGCPALHETLADHELELPNGARPGRMFGSQRFLHHIAAETRWTPFNGGEAQETAIADATGQLADFRTIRPAGASAMSFAPHRGELVFGFVLDGTARCGDAALCPADAFVIPPGEPWSLSGMSDDFRLLHLTTAALGENKAFLSNGGFSS